MKYPKISALLNLTSENEALTDQHMTAAEDRLAALEKSAEDAQAALDTKTQELATATESLNTANASLTDVKGQLTTANDQVAQLEKWKKEQALVDGRGEDEANKRDQPTVAKADFELEAEALIERVRNR